MSWLKVSQLLFYIVAEIPSQLTLKGLSSTAAWQVLIKQLELATCHLSFLLLCFLSLYFFFRILWNPHENFSRCCLQLLSWQSSSNNKCDFQATHTRRMCVGNSFTQCAYALCALAGDLTVTHSFSCVCVSVRVDCFMCFLLIFVTFENIELQNIAVCFDALFHLSRLLKIKDDLVRAVLCLYWLLFYNLLIYVV